MSRYVPGDVILARTRIGETGEIKVRPVVVIHAGAGGYFTGYPISHTPSRDQPSIPLGLHDFREGGLDIMEESYVLTGQAIRINLSAVAGKKGRVNHEFMETICPGRGE